MQTIEPGRYCLNLHPRYVGDWGLWEVAREIYTNAKDASPDFSMATPDSNTLIISTPTIPEVSELFIMGCGSKTAGDQNIGQFGEGLKLAALVVARSGASLELKLGTSVITFEIAEQFGQPVLFACVEDGQHIEGYQVTLKMEGAGTALDWRIIDGAENRMIEKRKDAPLSVYCKGIWICDLPVKNPLFSYNLNEIKINRDRSMAEAWSIQTEAGKALLANLDLTLARRLLRERQSWESEHALNAVDYMATAAQREIFAEAFAAEYGDDACIATDLEAAAMATTIGSRPIVVADPIETILGVSVKRDVDLLKKSQEPEPVEWDDAWNPALAELQRLSDIVEIPFAGLKVFADNLGETWGLADLNDNVIWLNVRMMGIDNRFMRIKTFMHELAHIQSGAGDGSQAFEMALTVLIGKLGMMVLDGARI